MIKTNNKPKETERNRKKRSIKALVIFTSSASSKAPFSILSILSLSVIFFRSDHQMNRKGGSGSSNAKISRIGNMRSMSERIAINRIHCEKEQKDKAQINEWSDIFSRKS